MAAERLVDLLFEAHARAVALRREHGPRSEEYRAALEEVAELRRLVEEERIVRPMPKRRDTG
jgi:hypothetical protein